MSNMSYNPPTNQQWGPHHTNAPKSNTVSKIVIPVVTGIVALFVGLGVGMNTDNSEVVETSIPQACMDGFPAADTIRETASTIAFAMADHLRADQELFNNLTEQQVDLYVQEQEKFNALIEEQSKIASKAVTDLETAREGCK